MGIQNLGLFVASGLLLNITPGTDTLYIIGRATGQGWRAGATAALGIGAGCLLHIVGALVGLSSIIATSASAFRALKVVGAGYLIYLGVTLLREGSSAHTSLRPLERAPLQRVFVQGFLTNILNPKVALFFLAFLPQFIDTNAASPAFAALLLGLVFNVNGTLWNLFVAWAAAHAVGAGVLDARARTWFSRGVGSVLVGLGIRLALQ